ncbi:hypothetical protein A2U01_0107703, partial [Trifolium medium]|nr:hypothetical protein [Trifolium medium]
MESAMITVVKRKKEAIANKSGSKGRLSQSHNPSCSLTPSLPASCSVQK